MAQCRLLTSAPTALSPLSTLLHDHRIDLEHEKFRRIREHAAATDGSLDELIDIRGWLAAKALQHGPEPALDLLAEARVPARPIHRLADLAGDTSLDEAGFLYRCDGQDGTIPQVGLGIRFDSRTVGTTAPPPMLGADTVEILKSWLGCGLMEIQSPRAQRII